MFSFIALLIYGIDQLVKTLKNKDEKDIPRSIAKISFWRRGKRFARLP
jgi:hypothetical protein